MLNKKIILFEEIKDYQDFNVPLIIKVNSLEEINQANDFLSTYNNKLRGVQIKTSLLQEMEKDFFKDKRINYFSIVVTEETKLESLQNLINKCKVKNQFIELIVSINYYSNKIIENSIGTKRLILNYKNNLDLFDGEKLNEISSEMILYKLYPLILGVPFCKVDKKDYQHLVELFENKDYSKINKSIKCNGCALKKYCSYDEEDVDPINLESVDKSILKYLEEKDTNETFTSRI